MESVVSRRPCFVEEDDGLASLADMEAGVSGNHINSYAFFSRPLSYGRRNSLRNLSSMSSSSVCSSSPRSGPRFYDARYEEPQPHFLEACFLCKKPLGNNRDIFMYRGDTPFCSEECRQEQIEIDEAREKNLNLSSIKALRNKEQKKSPSPTKNQDFYRAGTVAAA